MATRAPLTEAEKQYIYARKQEGASLQQAADELNCARETVGKWWRHLRDGTRPRPRGRPRKGILSTYPAAVREQAVAIKRAHPHWGSANVKLELKRQPDVEEEDLPSKARLSALFKAVCPEAVQPRQRRHYPEKPPAGVTRPHQRWQVDEKEALKVGDERVNILHIRDPVAALMIASRAFVTTTEKGWRKLSLPEVQDTLRYGFATWGLPLQVQTDRGKVYAGDSQNSFPTLFTLWLVGLGIEHVLSRSRCPTDQPQVERSHRTLGDMAWKDEDFELVQQLQSALDKYSQRHNLELPVQAAHCNGRPPLEVYPWARHSGRPFHPDLEWELFDMQRVDTYLARYVWTRKVSTNGIVNVGRHAYYVGKAHVGQSVSVRFLSATRAFCFQSAAGDTLAQWPAVGLDKVDIIGRMPVEETIPLVFQLPLPLEGV